MWVQVGFINSPLNNCTSAVWIGRWYYKIINTKLGIQGVLKENQLKKFQFLMCAIFLNLKCLYLLLKGRLEFKYFHKLRCFIIIMKCIRIVS